MKLKKVLAVSLAAAMTLSMAACGSSSSDSSTASDDATTGSLGGHQPQLRVGMQQRPQMVL